MLQYGKQNIHFKILLHFAHPHVCIRNFVSNDSSLENNAAGPLDDNYVSVRTHAHRAGQHSMRDSVAALQSEEAIRILRHGEGVANSDIKRQENGFRLRLHNRATHGGDKEDDKEQANLIIKKVK